MRVEAASVPACEWPVLALGVQSQHQEPIASKHIDAHHKLVKICLLRELFSPVLPRARHRRAPKELAGRKGHLVLGFPLPTTIEERRRTAKEQS